VAGKYTARLAQLEAQFITPPVVHTIIKRNEGQTDQEAFDLYQLRAMSSSVKFEESWTELRRMYLSGQYQSRFITYNVLDSVAPKPPIVTRHTNNEINGM